MNNNTTLSQRARRRAGPSALASGRDGDAGDVLLSWCSAAGAAGMRGIGSLFSKKSLS